MQEFYAILPYLLPILILDLGLKTFALVDLARRQTAKGPKWLWALIILLVNIIGPILYFVIGRED